MTFLRRAAPESHVLPGDPPIEVAIRRSARARRLTLRVSHLDGRAMLTMPERLPWSQALAFLGSRESWLRAHCGQSRDAALPPGTLMYRGQMLTVAEGGLRRPELRGGTLILPAGARRGAVLTAWLKSTARDALAEACDRYSARLGRPFRSLRLRDTRSRWGSCSPQGDLMFSWRLIMAPPAVLDYVAAHEVAHLARMDHSPAFWAVVADLCPGYAAERAWLREHGATLHRVDLGD